jgi:hypothetical protein
VSRPRAIRWVATVVCLLVGIPGMIVSSIAENTGAAVTFGLVAAAGSLVLLVLGATSDGMASSIDEDDARQLEAKVQALVAEGADEEQVRDLVRAALRAARPR